MYPYALSASWCFLISPATAYLWRSRLEHSDYARDRYDRGTCPRQMVDMLALPLDHLNGWLFGVNADRVKPGVRERLIRYQRDRHRVLTQAFQQQCMAAAYMCGGH